MFVFRRFKFIADIIFGIKVAKIEREVNQKFPGRNTKMTLYEKANYFDLIQHQQDDGILFERSLLKTLAGIYRDYENDPVKLKEEVSAFLDFWGECCDSTDGKYIDYQGEGDYIEDEDEDEL